MSDRHEVGGARREGVNTLYGERVGPVVRDGAHEEHRGLCAGSDERRVGRKEVLRLEGDTTLREYLGVFGAPCLFRP